MTNDDTVRSKCDQKSFDCCNISLVWLGREKIYRWWNKNIPGTKKQKASFIVNLVPVSFQREKELDNITIDFSYIP